MHKNNVKLLFCKSKTARLHLVSMWVCVEYSMCRILIKIISSSTKLSKLLVTVGNINVFIIFNHKWSMHGWKFHFRGNPYYYYICYAIWLVNNFACSNVLNTLWSHYTCVTGLISESSSVASQDHEAQNQYSSKSRRNTTLNNPTESTNIY